MPNNQVFVYFSVTLTYFDNPPNSVVRRAHTITPEIWQPNLIAVNLYKGDFFGCNFISPTIKLPTETVWLEA